MAEVAYAVCDACAGRIGPYHSYQEWEDAARAHGWYIGEEILLCPDCGATEPDPFKTGI